ncbi:MAG: MurR/RpiR family transcriptional regulator [Coprobacillaceae bacterium]
MVISVRLEELINKNYDHLNENDLYIWKYIMQHKKECVSLSIDELAKRCHVSRTTILRFSKRLGLKGYAELKVYLRIDNETYKQADSGLERIYHTYSKYMKEMKNKDFSSIIKYIHQARNLYAYGTGAIQNNVAAELKRSFLMVDKLFFNIRSINETDAFVNIMNHQDIIIMISYSGENEAMLEFVKKLKTKGIPIISITANKDNSLAQQAVEALYVEIPNIVNPIGARYEGLVNYFVLIDFLVVKYMDYLGKEEVHV